MRGEIEIILDIHVNGEPVTVKIYGERDNRVRVTDGSVVHVDLDIKLTPLREGKGHAS